MKNSGVRGLSIKIKAKYGKKGMSYHDWYVKNAISEQELESQRKRQFEYRPLISIIVPTYNTPIDFLTEMIESLERQSYENWELCIGDGSEGNAQVEKALKELSEKDVRIKYVILPKNMGISGNTNGALELAKGEYIGLLDHDDFLAPQALYRIVEELQNKDIDVFYSDEDFVSGDGQTHIFPILKPDYSEELLCSHNYITHFFVVKRKIVIEVGGFISEFDGSQDYDLIFRCIEEANTVKHIPEVLYHWRMHAASVAGDPDSKKYAYEAGKHAIEKHFERTGIHAEVDYIKGLHGMYHPSYAVEGEPRVSIIVAQKHDNILVEKNITRIIEKSSYKNLEFVIVSTSSYKELTDKYQQIQVCHFDGNANYAHMNNLGAKKASGELLLFLNDELTITKGNEIAELVGICAKENIGVAGAKVLFKDNTVRHAGIILGRSKKIEYAFVGIDNMNDGYLQRPRVNCNYSAVSGLCMMVRKELFQKLKGFDERLDDGISDVAFCCRMLKYNKKIVYMAHSQWITENSKVKKFTIKRNINRASKAFLVKLERIEDPYYNKNFSQKADLFDVNYR